MNRILIILCMGFLSLSSSAQLVYTLDDIILRAREQSPASKQAETRRENLYWNYRLYRSNYNPQLRLSGNAPGYNRDFFGNRQDDNTIKFQERQQMYSQINLGLEQPIAVSGGQVSVNTNMNRFQDFENELNTWNTTLVNISLVQPLFAYNELKWDRRTEPLRYEESRRSYVEEMEFISSQAVNLFFNYLNAQVNLDIAEFNLSKQDTIFNIETGRYNIGTTTRDKLLQVELQLLRSQQDVTQANQDLQNARLSLQSYLSFDEGFDYEFVLPENIPDFDVAIPEALEYARNNRSDYIAFERRRLEAAAQLAEAKGNRFNVNMTASYGLNSTGPTIGDSYTDPNNQQRLNLSFDIPIMDWGRNKARTRTAMANKQLTDYVIAQEEQTFEQEIITQVNLFEVLRSSIEISKKSDEVAQERYEVAQNQYLIGKIDITNLNIALQEKDAAKRSYLSSLQDFWTAYYDLRRLTLYDFSGGNLLYSVDD